MVMSLILMLQNKLSPTFKMILIIKLESLLVKLIIISSFKSHRNTSRFWVCKVAQGVKVLAEQTWKKFDPQNLQIILK